MFEQIFGNIFAEIGNDIAKFGAVDTHDDDIARLCTDKNKNECVKDIFRVTQGDRAGDNDDTV